MDGSILAYSGGVDIVLLDLATQNELVLPDGINTRRVETHPSISGTSLLFVRVGGRRFVVHRVVLADTSTGSQATVFSRVDTDRRFFVVVSAQLNGGYAAWSTPMFNRHFELVGGDVWLYDAAAGTTTKISAGKASWEYGPSVSEDGTVYFGRSSFACGVEAQLIARSLDGSEAVLYDLPRGQDFTSSFALNDTDGTTDLLVDIGDCAGDPGDIWRFDDV